MAGPSKDKDRIKLINDLMFRKRTIVRDVIIQLSIHNKTSFVFGILKDKDFADVKEDNDFGTIKKWQYNKLIGTRAYYNRLLKCVAKQAGITKDMTAHLSRHSAVSLMVEMGIDINLFDIMNALGHKHITTTQTYLQKFTNKKLDKINKILSDAFESKWILGEDGKAYNSLQKPMVN
jgi:integrase